MLQMLYKNTTIYPYLFTYCNITSAYTYPTGLEPLKTLEKPKTYQAYGNQFRLLRKIRNSFWVSENIGGVWI